MGITISDAISIRYDGLLNRVPDASGLAFWKGRAELGLTTAQIAIGADSVNPALWQQIDAAIIGSAEFQANAGRTGVGDSAFVTSLYLNFLGRAPDSAGAAYWTNLIATTGTAGRIAITEDFSGSAEYFATRGVLTTVAVPAGQGYTQNAAGNYQITAAASSTPITIAMGNTGTDYIDVALTPGSTINLSGSTSNHVVTLGGGNNSVVVQGNGYNVITGGNGNNSIILAAGDKAVVLGSGNNNITLGTGTSTVTVGSGTNSISTAGGSSTKITFSGNDGSTATNTTIYAGAGATETLVFGSGTVNGNLNMNQLGTQASVSAGVAAANLSSGFNVFTVGGNTHVYEYTGSAATSELVTIAGLHNISVVNSTTLLVS